MIPNLIDPSLLRQVRDEVTEHVSFSPKETDIYKIHQSGDLANLDGLGDSSLHLLPSLIKLRDALYSPAFRQYVAAVAGAGPLSGRKTDMAINVYTPGCHLLCHDDVIGSRRVSYILYLTDPDRPWRAEWGGALRLYPTDTFRGEDGVEAKVPCALHSVAIPPAFNQLAFFAVQPGESFHDVEEVYARKDGDAEDDGGRVRMAISGWYHIPQEGEDGYEEGLEEKLAEKSSLVQLQGKTDRYDLPQPQWQDYGDSAQAAEDIELSEEDLQFLVRFITPSYLTPDTVENLAELFAEESSLRLSNFLSPTFSNLLRPILEVADNSPDIPAPPSAAQRCGVARPPHKHRFLYRQPGVDPDNLHPTPYDELIDTFFPSVAFRKWLALATGLTLTRANVLARRFRRGADYTLATAYEDATPQLEVCLGITPSGGWGDDENDDVEQDMSSDSEGGGVPLNGADTGGASPPQEMPKSERMTKEDGDYTASSVGGYDIYMAGDDDDSDSVTDPDPDVTAIKHNSHARVQPGPSSSASTTGAARPARLKARSDPAVYKSAASGDDDEGVLFSATAGWNSLSVVLRDEGVLRFTKYVSRAAKGDRWDVMGECEVRHDEDDAKE